MFHLIDRHLVSCSASKSKVTLNISNRGQQTGKIRWWKWHGVTSSNIFHSLKPDDRRNRSSGAQIPYQLVTNGTDSLETLIFPVTLAAGASGTYQIAVGEPETFQPLVYGRLVPERKDDFTWENNRTAFVCMVRH